MENLNINSLDDIAASSASLEINRINSGSGVQIAIRGIASSPGSLGIEQSVAVMIDGVYFPQGRVINEGLFDTNQVAILKALKHYTLVKMLLQVLFLLLLMIQEMSLKFQAAYHMNLSMNQTLMNLLYQDL